MKILYIYIYIFFGPTCSRWNKANVWRCWKATDLTTFLNVFFLYIIFFVGLTTIEGKAQICRESSIMLPSANLKPLTLYIAVTKVYQISNWNSKQSLWCFFFCVNMYVFMYKKKKKDALICTEHTNLSMQPEGWMFFALISAFIFSYLNILGWVLILKCTETRSDMKNLSLPSLFLSSAFKSLHFQCEKKTSLKCIYSKCVLFERILCCF